MIGMLHLPWQASALHYTMLPGEMAALFTWHHNCCHFHHVITPFSIPHHLSITAQCNKTKMQNTILTSDIGNVAQFYGDASTNYHTTIKPAWFGLSCLGWSWLVSCHNVPK
jgi:hypothetical protein